MSRALKKQRLSQTTLWDMQSRAYQSLGIEAWTERGIPSYLTSNPFIAKRYANVAFAYLIEEISSGRIKKNQPFTLFELGAGTGRFTYLFLKYFLRLVQESPFSRIQIRYVMTDLSPELIAGWRRHPYFQRLFEKGLLDSARLDLSEPAAFYLQGSSRTICPGSEQNPCVVITNYLFGYLASDLFAKRGDGLAEGLVTLDARGVNDAHEPQVEDLLCRVRYQKLASVGDYYPSATWNRALEATAAELSPTPFTLPIGAFRALDFFREVAPSGYCLLAADRGAVTPDQIAALQGISVSRNALCAMAINCRALIHYFLERGESACTTRQPHPTFVVLAARAGPAAGESGMIQRAFSQNLSDFEPADYWELVNRFEGGRKSPSLEEIYLLLKLGDWDSTNFHAFFTPIRDQLKSAECGVQTRWADIIDSIFDNFFPISKLEANLIVNMGVLLFDMKCYAKALLYFQRAHLIGGEQARIFFNMGLCYSLLRESEEAASCFAKAEKLDAAYSLQARQRQTAQEAGLPKKDGKSRSTPSPRRSSPKRSRQTPRD